MSKKKKKYKSGELIRKVMIEGVEFEVRKASCKKGDLRHLYKHLD